MNLEQEAQFETLRWCVSNMQCDECGAELDNFDLGCKCVCHTMVQREKMISFLLGELLCPKGQGVLKSF